MMTHFAAKFATLLTIGSIVVGSAGCSLKEDTLQRALDKAQEATSPQKTLFTSFNTGGLGGDTEAGLVDAGAGGQATGIDGEANPQLSPLAATVPYPHRTDPFEFGEGIDYDAPQSRENENLEIKLFGFIGNERPKAILSVAGRTKMLAAGDKWGVLEVLDVTPPKVRIKSGGVVRVWSLLGHHQENSFE